METKEPIAAAEAYLQKMYDEGKVDIKHLSVVRDAYAAGHNAALHRAAESAQVVEVEIPFKSGVGSHFDFVVDKATILKIIVSEEETSRIRIEEEK